MSPITTTTPTSLAATPTTTVVDIIEEVVEEYITDDSTDGAVLTFIYALGVVFLMMLTIVVAAVVLFTCAFLCLQTGRYISDMRKHMRRAPAPSGETKARVLKRPAGSSKLSFFRGLCRRDPKERKNTASPTIALELKVTESKSSTATSQYTKTGQLAETV